MKQDLVIREYGLIGSSGETSGLDRIVIPKRAWNWLRQYMLSRNNGEGEFLRPVFRNGKEYLQVRNYVGILETPFGIRIEILPKTTKDHAQSVTETRRLLYRMLTKVMKLPWVSTTDASLKTFDKPLIEILIQRFLIEVSRLIRRGIRSDYVRKLDNTQFLRGSLKVALQLREPITRQHRFWVEYDEYLPDKPENRLIHSSLNRVLRWSKSAENQRIARELFFAFSEIPLSENIKRDLENWSKTRDMVHYRPLRPWCELILTNQTPFALPDKWEGVSMLFPMEILFERYVAISLRRQLTSQFHLKEQSTKCFLARHKDEKWFQLRPDLTIERQGKLIHVLDTKWKLISEKTDSKREKYGLSQADFYQLFAYSHKYLQGEGDIYLIYPGNEDFSRPLSPFFLDDPDDKIRLFVVPFDMERSEVDFPQGWEVSVS